MMFFDTFKQAIHYMKYSTASDVWSFGCVMFEIWTVGKKPFENYSNIETLKMVDLGYQLPPPPGCPQELYKLMVQCWWVIMLVTCIISMLSSNFDVMMYCHKLLSSSSLVSPHLMSIAVALSLSLTLTHSLSLSLFLSLSTSLPSSLSLLFSLTYVCFHSDPFHSHRHPDKDHRPTFEQLHEILSDFPQSFSDAQLLGKSLDFTNIDSDKVSADLRSTYTSDINTLVDSSL